MKQLLLLLSLFFVSNTWATPHFIENKGQIQNQYGAFRSDIDFVLKEKSFQLFIGKGILIWQFQKSEQGDRVAYNRMEARLLNFNPNTILQTEKPLLTQYHYYLPGCGQDGAHAQSFDKITYQNIYPGIDWEIYINQNGKVEYDFVLHPGADLSRVKMEISGAEKVSLPRDGSLLATCNLGEVRQALPLAFDSKGNSIACHYVLEENILSFHAAAPKGEKWLIDPEVEWGTYYGGEQDEAPFHGVITTRGNCLLIYGNTQSTTNIATTGAYQDTLGGSVDTYLALFDPAGHPIWATYLGGPGADQTFSIVSDAAGNLFLAGGVQSNDLATTGAYQTTKDPNGNVPFMARFNYAGYRVWFTYFGGQGSAYSITLSPDSSLYVTGTQNEVSSTGYPIPNISTPGAHQGMNGGGGDAFLVKMDLDGQPIWATYYGGSSNENPSSVFADEQSNVYLAGNTQSSNAIATPGSFQPSYAGLGDGFLVKFGSNGQRIWGSYFGGEKDDDMFTVIARDNRCYLLCRSKSEGMATPGAHQQTNAGNRDLLLSAWDTTGNRLWSTYYGGPAPENINTGFKALYFIDSDLLVSGITASDIGIATAGSYMPVKPNYQYSGLMARFDTAGALLWGSYIGGNISEMDVVAVPADSNVIYIAGATASTSGISTPGAYQETNNGGTIGRDAFLIKLKLEQPADTSVGIAPVTVLHGNAIFTLSPNPVQQSATLSGLAPESAFPLNISCTDATGKIIWQQSVKQQADLPLSFDFSCQPPGVYLIGIKGRGVAQNLKVVKE